MKNIDLCFPVIPSNQNGKKKVTPSADGRVL
ncbi:hypothetical protein EZS27_035880, partial [termite gut metagenome]